MSIFIRKNEEIHKKTYVPFEIYPKVPGIGMGYPSGLVYDSKWSKKKKKRIFNQKTHVFPSRFRKEEETLEISSTVGGPNTKKIEIF